MACTSTRASAQGKGSHVPLIVITKQHTSSGSTICNTCNSYAIQHNNTNALRLFGWKIA